MAYSYNNVKLDKGMYSEKGMSFTQVLEKLDPSENYRGTSLEGLDAFQRQLKRFDIKAKGMGSDTVEKFFHTYDSSILFPEYVARSVRAGMDENNVLPNITAAVTNIDSMSYRSLYCEPSTEAKSLRRVEEGTSIPQTEILAQENNITLHKRGRMLVASYEAIRSQRLDLFSVMLRQIGNQIMRMHLEDAIDVIINGDGNYNAATQYSIGTSPIGGTSGTLTYSELLDFWSQFDPFTMNTILVSPATMLKILKCSEFQNPLAGFNFQGTGEAGNPLGAKLIRTSAVSDDVIIGLDHNYALEMIRSGDVSVEYDRLIDRQLERAAITSISGYAKLYTDASAVLNI